MKQTTKVTISQDLTLQEIKTDGSFPYNHILDLRCTESGGPRPIEEASLKCLKNHFISYDQMPLVNSESGPCQEVHFCETLDKNDGQTLVLADDIAHVAALMNIYQIPFESRVLYVVETGRGDVVKSMVRPYQTEKQITAVAI
ncbi:MAG: hypothetical protein AAGA53_15110 [Pseudomonadota bacterium]